MSENRAKPNQYMLRFPEGMRDRLKATAKANARSMNEEIIGRLEASLGPANPDYEIAPARARVKKAMMELKDAIAELELAETLW